MRYMGLDLGSVTLGISLSDKTNTIATPLKTIRFLPGKYESIIPEIREIVEEKKITDFVLGLPKTLKNQEEYAALRSLEFKKILEKNFCMPVHLVDERFSTVEATRILISTDMKRKKRKKVVDNIAATLILETYLKRKEDNL